MAQYRELTLFLFALVTMTTAEPPACKIRITSRGLEMLKTETQRFVEQELGNMTMPEIRGNDGNIQYIISEVRITELNLTGADLRFMPDVGLLFDVQDSSIALSFKRNILYWFLHDVGMINASAHGVNIFTALHMSRDDFGRLKISNVTCDAAVNRMRANFSGTLARLYQFLATFLTTAMRFLLNQQICPVLDNAGLIQINKLLDTMPVRSDVDDYVGIDYSLMSDPVVTAKSLDLDFRGMYYPLMNENDTIPNRAVTPVIRQYDRMVYMALSEYFFDSGFYAYYKAKAFHMLISKEKMPKDLEMLLRTTYFGTIMMLNPNAVDAPMSLELKVTSPPHCTIKTSGASVAVKAMMIVMLHPPGQPSMQLSSMTMEGKLTAKVSLKGKRLAVHMDLRRFKIYSNQSALESLALIPLQAPLKTMLQLSVVPILNDRTKRGVQIPLPEGIDFVEEVVEYHNGFIIIGANLHFTKGLREVIEKSQQGR